MKQTVVFDFDGVIHSYKSGWIAPDIIPDEPVEKIKNAIDDIKTAGYKVVIASTRCASSKGRNAIEQWLKNNNITVDEICATKPPAVVYIDDRAICFDGKPENLLNQIKNFKPWYQKE